MVRQWFTFKWLVDGWGNAIRYAVTAVNTSSVLPNTPDFTTTNKMRDVGMLGLAPDMRICADAAHCSITQYLSQNVIAVIFSTGANFNQSMGVDEVANLNASTVFYSRDFTTNSVNTTAFDDIFVWISPYILYHHMLEAGQF